MNEWIHAFKADSVCLQFSLKPLLKKNPWKFVLLQYDVRIRNVKYV